MDAGAFVFAGAFALKAPVSAVGRMCAPLVLMPLIFAVEGEACASVFVL